MNRIILRFIQNSGQITSMTAPALQFTEVEVVVNDGIVYLFDKFTSDGVAELREANSMLIVDGNIVR